MKSTTSEVYTHGVGSEEDHVAVGDCLPRCCRRSIIGDQQSRLADHIDENTSDVGRIER